MLYPSGPGTEERLPTATSATLTVPEPGEEEKRFRIQSKVDGDPTRDVEAQSSLEEKAREDEEWLQNPAHPRNWPSRKKWANMAVVSRSPPSLDHPQHLTRVILGFILHVFTPTHKLNDGAGPTADR
jgi:hypothetical protein